MGHAHGILDIDHKRDPRAGRAVEFAGLLDPLEDAAGEVLLHEQ